LVRHLIKTGHVARGAPSRGAVATPRRQARRLPVRQGPGGCVTEPDDVLLGRAEIERAFTALGERLVRRGVVADVFVVGGALWLWLMMLRA
jgi:hypothetical protein